MVQPEVGIASPQGNSKALEEMLGAVERVLAADTLGDGFVEGADDAE